MKHEHEDFWVRATARESAPFTRRSGIASTTARDFSQEARKLGRASRDENFGVAMPPAIPTPGLVSSRAHRRCGEPQSLPTSDLPVTRSRARARSCPRQFRLRESPLRSGPKQGRAKQVVGCVQSPSWYARSASVSSGSSSEMGARYWPARARRQVTWLPGGANS